jgi:hypothetical protein
MEWSNMLSLRLIDLYREKELMWNPTHAGYKSKLKRLDAWNEISQLLGCDQTELRKKVESLLILFLRDSTEGKFQHNTSHTSEPQRIDWRQSLG